ncbi:MAG: hypothetical protein K8T25_20905, partial [Planctomycetia bacterium]|nr:hypothetical protein [Planctomycetia bacterium]
MPLLRRATCAALAAACVLLAGSAQAQRTEFATPLATPPPAFTPPPAGAPAIPTLNAPNATFGGTIQPVAPGFDPYADPAAQAAAGYQPGAMTQQATTGGDGYLFLRPDGSLGEWPRFLQQARFRYTWLDGNGGYDNGLGMNIAEIDGTFVLPFPYSQNAPLLITPGFAVDWTQGPITS